MVNPGGGRVTRRSLDRAALLAAAPASLQARNATPAPAGRPAATRKAHAHVGDRPGARTGPLDATAGVVVELPGLRLRSEANARGHTLGAKSTRAKAVRAAVLRALAGRVLPPLPVRVCVTRVAPRRVDTDNLASACKSPRDSAAEALGIDDGPAETRAVWREAQVVGPVAVRVTIVPVDGRASVTVGERADEVRLRLTRGEADALVAGLRVGRARVTVGGVVVEMEVR